VSCYETRDWFGAHVNARSILITLFFSDSIKDNIKFCVPTGPAGLICILMGLFNKIANLFGLKKHEVKVLVVGLNNSGKSTVLNHLKADDDKSTEVVPTVGFSVEKFKS